MATAAVLQPVAPHELATPDSYWRCPFELPEKRFVGLLACQRTPFETFLSLWIQHAPQAIRCYGH
jgi:hypothetical protein